MALLCGCINPYGKYIVVLNMPQKFNLPYILMGILLIAIVIFKTIFINQMFARKEDPIDLFRILKNPLFIFYCLVVTLLYIPSPADKQNLVYTLFVDISVGLGVAGVAGFYKSSPFTNLWVSLYTVLYISNVWGMWAFAGTNTIMTWGEGINFLVCLVLVYGIWDLG
mmetsp:Transcript_4671/g.4375  ORF Transcript_4671/g.4375 Transcript_4671/m.4375 type:complete len:167 (+) Transcript_4671:240-740(+)